MSVSAMPVDIGAMIARTPGIKRGSPHIAGTGVLVRTIARWNNAGLSPEEIAARIGHLKLEQVHAALAYYYANKDAVDAELVEADADADRLEAAARK